MRPKPSVSGNPQSVSLVLTADSERALSLYGATDVYVRLNIVTATRELEPSIAAEG